MDLRSEETIRRKKEEIRIAREKIIEKRREADFKRLESERKQREEEKSDEKADKAQTHSNRLRHDRNQALIKIQNYQRKIDSYAMEMTSCEKRIDALRDRIKTQIEDMRAKRQEAIHLRYEVNRLEREADLNCIPGKLERELHGLNKYSRQKELLQKAEEIMQKAIYADKIAQDLDIAAKKDGDNVVVLGDQLLVNGRYRGELEKDKIQEEQKVAKLGEKLKTYKVEIYNCEYLSRKLREDGAKHEEDSYRLEEQAVMAERLAEQAEEEIKRLERELASKQT